MTRMLLPPKPSGATRTVFLFLVMLVITVSIMIPEVLRFHIDNISSLNKRTNNAVVRRQKKKIDPVVMVMKTKEAEEEEHENVQGEDNHSSAVTTTNKEEKEKQAKQAPKSHHDEDEPTGDNNGSKEEEEEEGTAGLVSAEKQQQQQQQESHSTLLPKPMIELKMKKKKRSGSVRNSRPTRITSSVVGGNAVGSAGSVAPVVGGGERVILKFHKMGTFAVKRIFRNYGNANDNDNQKVQFYDPGQGPKSRGYVNQLLQNATNDNFRMVAVIRNIYDALISGYLYHVSGRECWINPYGELDNNPVGKPWTTKHWKRYVYNRRYDSDNLYNITPTSSNNITRSISVLADKQPRDDVGKGRNLYSSLCRYLIGVNEEQGMRAYIEYAIQTKYKSLLEMKARTLLEELDKEDSAAPWSNSNSTIDVQEQSHNYHNVLLTDKIKFICLNELDLSKKKKVHAAVNGVLDFLYSDANNQTTLSTSNNMPYKPWHYKPGMSKDLGRHSTSHDHSLRTKLIGLIRDVDQKYYSGDIAFIDSIIQC